MQAGGLGEGRSGAQQQQEQDGHGCVPRAGPHAVGKGCSPLLQLSDGSHRRVQGRSAAFTLMEPLIYTLKTSLHFLSPFPDEQYWGFKSFIKPKCHLGSRQLGFPVL